MQYIPHIAIIRVGYMKYIYPYECEKYDFSKASELQAAIDGNRREGRRPGYGYDITSPGAMPPFYNPQTFPATNPFFNPSVMSSPMANLLSTQLNGYMHSNGLGGHISHPRIPTTAPHNVNLHEMEERAHSPIDVSSPITSSNQSAFSRPHAVTSYDSCTSAAKRQRHSSGEGINVTNNDNDNEFRGQGKITSVTSDDSRNCRTEANTGDFKDTLPKLPKTESRDQSLSIKLGSSSRSPGLSSTNIKITNNEDYTKKESDSSSLTVSMEVNGVLYEGILLAKR
ncbi:ARID3A [Bugula neritina]|uniref:ARID3A n=1 Tax=Bugula neritina TaxID=10212 RepID=A0A7J7J4L1_BUGNE|nr:ARID3A [Bugula neritina]